MLAAAPPPPHLRCRGAGGAGGRRCSACRRFLQTRRPIARLHRRYPLCGTRTETCSRALMSAAYGGGQSSPRPGPCPGLPPPSPPHPHPPLPHSRAAAAPAAHCPAAGRGRSQYGTPVHVGLPPQCLTPAAAGCWPAELHAPQAGPSYTAASRTRWPGDPGPGGSRVGVSRPCYSWRRLGQGRLPGRVGCRAGGQAAHLPSPRPAG